MTVYGELLFLENFITGLVILYLTGKLCGKKRSRSGMLLGGLMCGTYSFVLFVPMVWPAALAGKLAFSLVVILAAFGYGSRAAYLKTVGVFYIVSFLMGGVTVVLMYVTAAPGLAANGSVYLHQATWLQVAAGVFATWTLGNWLAGFIRGKLQREKVFADMRVEIGGKEWEMRAFVDTGNFLRDPVSGKPAAVLSASCGKKLIEEMPGEEALDSRTCVIPYRTVGEKGILQGVRPDRVIVAGRSIEKIVLAISKEDFKRWNGQESYEVLLQQQIIEEGALEYAK